MRALLFACIVGPAAPLESLVLWFRHHLVQHASGVASPSGIEALGGLFRVALHFYVALVVDVVAILLGAKLLFVLGLAVFVQFYLHVRPRDQAAEYHPVTATTYRS